MDDRPTVADNKPDWTEMKQFCRHWCRRPLQRGLAILALLNLALPIAPKANAAAVSVHRYSFYHACFFATIDPIAETARRTNVRLKIEHKQSSGHCGCKSALLKALVFEDAINPSGGGSSLANKRLVQTSSAFPNTRENHDVFIPKRADGSPEHYMIWVACASQPMASDP
jgi:hypothetical protein